MAVLRLSATLGKKRVSAMSGGACQCQVISKPFGVSEFDFGGLAMSKASFKRGFTLVELLVVIGIIAALIAILLPSLNRARQSAARISCASQMKQLANAFAMYINDSKGVYPPNFYGSANPIYDNGNSDYTYDPTAISWVSLLAQRLAVHTDATSPVTMKVFTCPNDNNFARWNSGWMGGGPLTYAMPSNTGVDPVYNPVLGLPSGTWRIRGMGQVFNRTQSWRNSSQGVWLRTSQVKPATNVILLTEVLDLNKLQNPNFTVNYWDCNPMAQMKSFQLHQGLFNYLFCDGHVEALRVRDTIKPQYKGQWNDPLVDQGGWSWPADGMWTSKPDVFPQY